MTTPRGAQAVNSVERSAQGALNELANRRGMPRGKETSLTVARTGKTRKRPRLPIASHRPTHVSAVECAELRIKRLAEHGVTIELIRERFGPYDAEILSLVLQGKTFPQIITKLNVLTNDNAFKKRVNLLIETAIKRCQKNLLKE